MQKEQNGEPSWYKQEPTLAWGIVVGIAAAWIYIAPIAFNQGAVGASLRESSLNSMLMLTPYPQLYDDRVALYFSAIACSTLFFIIGLPTIILRTQTRWTAISLFLCTSLGLLFIFIWVPRCDWLWLLITILFLIGTICTASKQLFFQWLCEPLTKPKDKITTRTILALFTAVNFFLIIPAAIGSYFSTQTTSKTDEPIYLLLMMNDENSPLHEEFVELLATSTEYLVIRLSDKTPHPDIPYAPETLPLETQPGEFRSEQYWMPMLVRRDSVAITIPSFDPNEIIEIYKKQFSKLPLTTQPVFKISKNGPSLTIESQFTIPSTQPDIPPAEE